MKKTITLLTVTGVLLLLGGIYIRAGHENKVQTIAGSESKTSISKERKKRPIPYGDNYTVRGCIEKFRTYNNFENAIKDSSFMTDDTVVILEPDVNPTEAALRVPGDGISHLINFKTGETSKPITGKDPRATTIKHIKEALKVVDENAK